jgi:hypothetical protein
MDLWNAGDLLDYLDECIHDSQIFAAELVYAADNKKKSDSDNE